MNSIPCTVQIPFTSKPINSLPSFPKFSSKFLGTQKSLSWVRPSRIGPSNGSKTQCWFRFGKNGVDAEGAGIYGSQTRDDFDRDDVEQFYFLELEDMVDEGVEENMYFNYMGMLAVEGSYDKMEALLNQNIHPVDILLMLAASEGDKPKIEELLRAGASYDVKDADGRTAIDRAVNEEVKDLILSFSVQKA
ncbi:Ankyrin repeat family protein [Theobroma cacao]|uniref:Protein LHCP TRANSLOCATION DEFECT n=1 Tax=Theobroma cacao TaxID=3641 RepID=A0A061F6E8_THECC|nr:Ankyrin repeat family protein [Theobroma cacao]